MYLSVDVKCSTLECCIELLIVPCTMLLTSSVSASMLDVYTMPSSTSASVCAIFSLSLSLYSITECVFVYR